MLAMVMLLTAAADGGLDECPGNTPPVAYARTDQTVAWEKNYEVGEAAFVVVGETVLRRKQFIDSTSYTPGYCLLNDVDLKAGVGRRFQLQAGTDLHIRGWLNVDHERRDIAQWGVKSAFLVDKDLGVFPKLSNPTDFGWIVMIPGIKYYSEPPRIGRKSFISHGRVAGAENIELVYNGNDGQSLRFQYREYTADDLARPAFSQDLTYPMKAKVVRFKGFTLRIDDVSDDGLKFAVEDDGLGGGAKSAE